MKIGLVQYSPEWENKKENQKKINKLVESVDDVSLFIFPELTLTGFTMKADEFCEKIDGESSMFFSNLAARKNSHCLAGIIEKNEDHNYNTMLHLDNRGKIVNTYRKIHPFTYSTEDKYYTAGKERVVTEIENWKIGLSICYDLRFPELYRVYGKARTHLIVDIANWPINRIEHWRTLLKARAIENQCYVAGVNRVGSDPSLIYNGCSSVFDPMGNEILVSIDSEEVLIAEIEIETVNQVREKFPFLQDIRLV
ncbi:MAG: hypothetical protein K8H86_03275 [Ignavibacteriaceae bacterium]|nr:hypothetical protein [Ignavibacteriaceae bacterium]